VWITGNEYEWNPDFGSNSKYRNAHVNIFEEETWKTNGFEECPVLGFVFGGQTFSWREAELEEICEARTEDW
jgi:hypothetical protein